MALFGREKKQEPVFSGLLGIDIGTSGIKMVECTKEAKGTRITTYAYSEYANPDEVLKLLSDDAQIISALRALVSEGGIRATRAAVALPATEVFHTLVTVSSNLQGDSLREALEAQAKKVFPLPLEELALDHVVLPKDEHAPEQDFSRVFLTAAPKRNIQRLVEVCGKAGIDVAFLESESIASIRALLGKEDARVMIVDIGALRTNVFFVERGIPVLVRGIKTGGDDITKALMHTMSLSYAEAESAKRDMHVEGELPKSIQQALQPIVHEIKYALRLYAEQPEHPGVTVDKILLTGGCSGFFGIETYFTNVLGVTTYRGNPWSHIAIPQGSKPLLEEVGSRLVVAAGLAKRIGGDE